MRGVLLHGRRPPANRSGGPSRLPVGSGSRTCASRPGHAGQRLNRRPQGSCPEGRTPGTVARGCTTRLCAAHVSAARGQSLPGTPSARSAPAPVVPHRARTCGALTGRAQAPRQALPAPYWPPLARGRGHCPAGPGPVLTWQVSTATEPATAGSVSLPATGRNRLPGVSYVPNRLLRTNTSLP